METRYGFDVLWISYSHDRTDVQYLGALRRMAIATAKLRIAVASVSTGPPLNSKPR
ncbi:hypothetical protein ACVWY3_004695 [Bradyrhizobium sp. USDA 4486]